MHIIQRYSTGNDSRSKKRLDGANVSFFADQMKHVSPSVREKIKGSLVLFNLFPMEQVDAGKTMYEYQMFDSTGIASYTASKASDIPLVNRLGTQYVSPLATMDIAMEVSEADIEATLATSSNHVTKLRDQCVRGLYERMEETLLRGFTPAGLKGLFNYDAGGTAVGNNWYTAASDLIFADVAAAYQIISNQTSGNIVADTMLVSSTLYTILETKPNVIANTYVGGSLLKQIESSLSLQVVKVPKLNKAFDNNTKDGFFLIANSSEYIVHPMSIMFDATEPQRDGWLYTTYCRSKHGGLVVPHPKTIIARRMTVNPV